MTSLYPDLNNILLTGMLYELKKSVNILVGTFNSLPDKLDQFVEFSRIKQELEHIKIETEKINFDFENTSIQNFPILEILAHGLLHDLNKSFMAMSSDAYYFERIIKQKKSPIELLEGYREFTKETQGVIDQFRRLSNAFRSSNRVVKSPFNFRNSVTRQIQYLEPEFLNQNILIECEQATSKTQIIGDEGLFADIIFALLQNAIESLAKNQSGEKKINIRISESAEFIKITITDNGPGISEDIKPIITQPYITDKPDHSGLGLTMAKHNVESAFGGFLNYTSKKGLTSFTINLSTNAG